MRPRAFERTRSSGMLETTNYSRPFCPRHNMKAGLVFISDGRRPQAVDHHCQSTTERCYGSYKDHAVIRAYDIPSGVASVRALATAVKLSRSLRGCSNFRHL